MRFKWRDWRVYHVWAVYWPLELLGDMLWLAGDRLHGGACLVWQFTTPLYQKIDPVGVEWRMQQLEQFLATVERDKEVERL